MTHRQGRIVIELVRRRAGEVDLRRPRLAVYTHRDADELAIVQLIVVGTVLQRIDHAADAFLGVVLHMAHIGVHDVQPKLVDHLHDLPRAGFVRGDLSGEVGHVLLEIPDRVFARGQERACLRLPERPAVDHQEVVDQHAFLLDVAAVRRGRSRRLAADIGVMAPRGDIEYRLAALEHWRDDRDVRQVRAAVERRVQDEDVAFLHARVQPDHRADGFGHGAEMHRHMRRVRHQAAIRGEQGAGEIQTLLDVHAVGGVGERRAHLLGDVHEEVVEDLQHHRIRIRPQRFGPVHRDGAGQDQVPVFIQFGAPAGFDDICSRGFLNDRRTHDRLTGTHCVAVVERHGGTAKMRLHIGYGVGRGVGSGLLRVGDFRRAAHGLHRQRLEHQFALACGKTKPRLVRLVETGAEGRLVAEGHLQRLMRTLVSQMRAAFGADRGRVHALFGDFRRRLRRHVVQHFGRLGEVGQRPLKAALAERTDLR